MFYRGDQPHGLRHNPFNAIVVPRPIGWISTIDREGRPNLAPYSFFNGVAYTPPQVMFASTSAHQQGGGMKDTVANARDSGEFVVNICTWTLREAMNITAAPSPFGVNEFELAGLTAEASELVRTPRVKESPIHLECRFTAAVDLATADPKQPNTVAGNWLTMALALNVPIRSTVVGARNVLLQLPRSMRNSTGFQLIPNLGLKVPPTVE